MTPIDEITLESVLEDRSIRSSNSWAKCSERDPRTFSQLSSMNSSFAVTEDCKYQYTCSLPSYHMIDQQPQTSTNKAKLNVSSTVRYRGNNSSPPECVSCDNNSVLESPNLIERNVSLTSPGKSILTTIHPNVPTTASAELIRTSLQFSGTENDMVKDDIMQASNRNEQYAELPRASDLTPSNKTSMTMTSSIHRIQAIIARAENLSKLISTYTKGIPREQQPFKSIQKPNHCSATTIEFQEVVNKMLLSKGRVNDDTPSTSAHNSLETTTTKRKATNTAPTTRSVLVAKKASSVIETGASEERMTANQVHMSAKSIPMTPSTVPASNRDSDYSSQRHGLYRQVFVLQIERPPVMKDQLSDTKQCVVSQLRDDSLLPREREHSIEFLNSSDEKKNARVKSRADKATLKTQTEIEVLQGISETEFLKNRGQRYQPLESSNSSLLDNTASTLDHKRTETTAAQTEAAIRNILSTQTPNESIIGRPAFLPARSFDSTLCRESSSVKESDFIHYTSALSSRENVWDKHWTQYSDSAMRQKINAGQMTAKFIPTTSFAAYVSKTGVGYNSQRHMFNPQASARQIERPPIRNYGSKTCQKSLLVKRHDFIHCKSALSSKEILSGRSGRYSTQYFDSAMSERIFAAQVAATPIPTASSAVGKLVSRREFGRSSQRHNYVLSSGFCSADRNTVYHQ